VTVNNYTVCFFSSTHSDRN